MALAQLCWAEPILAGPKISPKVLGCCGLQNVYFSCLLFLPNLAHSFWYGPMFSDPVNSGASRHYSLTEQWRAPERECEDEGGEELTSLWWLWWRCWWQNEGGRCGGSSSSLLCFSLGFLPLPLLLYFFYFCCC